jgi:hypothetical protein
VSECSILTHSWIHTGSKRGNNPAVSGVASNTKGGQIQVFHNGKIVTPQSLLPRKTASGNLSKKKMTTNSTNQEANPTGTTGSGTGSGSGSGNKEEGDDVLSSVPPMLKDKKGSMKK